MALFVYDYGYGCARMLLVALFIGYTALVSGIWCFISHQIQWRATSKEGMCIIWCITTLGYLLYIHAALFIIFCVFEGNKIQCLLLPLGIRNQWLQAIRFFGLWPMLIFLVGMQVMIGFGLCVARHKQCFYYGGAFLCFLPFASGWIIPLAQDNPFILGTLVWCHRTTDIGSCSAWSQAQCLGACLNRIKEAQGQLHYTVLCPESSFDFPLNQYREAMSCLQNCSNLYIGAQRFSGSHYYNTIFTCQYGRIIHYYDKIKPLFLSEHLPWPLNKIRSISNLFLHDKIGYTPGVFPKLFVLNNYFVEPATCSELFFNNFKSYGPEVALLSLVNDRWFRAIYIKQLFFLHAQLTALVTGRRLIYISYSHGALIDPCGSITLLPEYGYELPVDFTL